MRVQNTDRSPDHADPAAHRPRRDQAFRRGAGLFRVFFVVAASTIATLGAAGLDVGTSAAATAEAATGSTSTVSISSWPDGLFGYVVTDQKGGRCGDGTVNLMEQVGPTQDTSTDKKIATVTASESTSGDRWTVRSKKSGQFYASLKSEPGCGGAVSTTIASESTNEPVPKCPSTAPVCSFQLSFDTNAFCPSFGASFGTCIGTSTGASTPWTEPVLSLPGLYATLLFTGSSSKFLSITGSNLVVVSAIEGTVPVSHSPNYTVRDAYAAKWSNPRVHFFTPDIRGVIAGQMGGPLWINFDNGYIGVSVHLHGFLYTK